MKIINMRSCGKFFPVLLSMFLVAGFLGLLTPTAALAVGGDITISGPGLNSSEPVTVTQAQLRGEEPLPDGTTLEQKDVWYSTINTWPTKWWYRGVGVKLTDLFRLAGELKPEATLIKFTSTDGFSVSFTVQEFINSSRYRFPNFMNTGLPGHLPGDASGPVQVETILAHKSVSAQVYEDIINDENLSTGDANLLLFGQQAVTEQTNARFAKYVTKIEVLTDPVPKWDQPRAVPSPGEVPAGTMVRLSGPKNDEDKIHYTLDGSDPTMESPMYNWIASRWWSSREEELDEINHPIAITKDTVIKAKVIGPGRADSDVVTFAYQVPLTAPPVLTADSTDNQVGQEIEITFEDHEAWRNAVSEVVVNDSPLDQDRYAFASGKITIYANAFAGAGDYTILIKAAGYQDAVVSQNIKGTSSNPGTKRPPTLNADTGENFVDEPIRITFTDDRAWREAICEIKVDGTVLNNNDYRIQSGYIEIADGVFTKPGTFRIVVLATGYSDASVTQKIIEDGDVALTITGKGVAETKTFTLDELKNMPQRQYVYSVINTWPSKKWYVGEGVELDDLFQKAGGITRDATLIKFFSRDGYYMTFTVEELLEDRRYYFPNFKEGGGDGDGHIPGSSSGKKVVKPILALLSAEGSDDPDDMNKASSLLLMMGQRAVTEQTGPLFTKYVKKIEVMTGSIPQWDEPKAEPDGGTVSAGTLVELSNKNMDLDKIHYTTDGSTPDLNSPMYNWISKRWWSARGANTVDKINHPIEITKNTVIKAITIGPGKEASDVVTFTYQVTGAATSKSDTISTNQDNTVSLENEAVIEIPAGAIKEGSKVEVKIGRVKVPSPAPEGLRIAGSVYEFTVDGKKSYSFLKKVTIKLRFNPKDFPEGETPSIYRYHEGLGKWENIGGTVKGDTISVQVDHLSKYAVLAPATSTGQTLTDIGGHWAEISIKELVGLGAVSGYPDGTFRPNDKITRAEFASILVKSLKLEQKNGKVFRDTAGHWAEGTISTAAFYGIVSGYDQNTFGAKDPITREQMAAMIVRAVKLTPVPEELSFKDKESISSWAKDAVAAAVKNGAIGGYPDQTLRPQANATRAEAVTVILKAMKSLSK